MARTYEEPHPSAICDKCGGAATLYNDQDCSFWCAACVPSYTKVWPLPLIVVTRDDDDAWFSSPARVHGYQDDCESYIEGWS